jgi:hypothetical protein
MARRGQPAAHCSDIAPPDQLKRHFDDLIPPFEPEASGFRLMETPPDASHRVPRDSIMGGGRGSSLPPPPPTQFTLFKPLNQTHFLRDSAHRLYDERLYFLTLPVYPVQYTLSVF